jgi:DNA-binding winged helix-turn-helix (wHTH) protein
VNKNTPPTAVRAHESSDVRWYEFGRFRLDARALVLFRGRRVVPLPPRAIETLAALVRRPGDVLPKSELVGKEWHDAPAKVATVARSISALRKALAASGRLIQTVPKRGYRFAGSVRAGGPGPKGLPGRVAAGGSPAASTAVDAIDLVLGWCEACDRHVWIASPAEAAAALGSTARGVYRAIESGAVHYRETTTGEIAVCMPSMIEGITAFRRSDR